MFAQPPNLHAGNLSARATYVTRWNIHHRAAARVLRACLLRSWLMAQPSVAFFRYQPPGRSAAAHMHAWKRRLAVVKLPGTCTCNRTGKTGKVIAAPQYAENPPLRKTPRPQTASRRLRPASSIVFPGAHRACRVDPKARWPRGGGPVAVDAVHRLCLCKHFLELGHG